MPTSHVPNLLEPVSTAEQRAEYAAGLRALADFVESTEFPIHVYGLRSELTVYSKWYDDEGFVRRVGSATRLIGGRVEKGADPWEDGAYWLRRAFGSRAGFRYVIDRDAVCESREVVDYVDEQVPVNEERAAQLKAELDSLETTTKVVAKTKTVFDCPPSLLEVEQARQGQS